jgi:phospholipase/carboxylesterase
MNFKRNSLNGIEYLEVRSQSADSLIVFFHGYGADAQDLAPLSSVLETGPTTSWCFPNGPIEVPIGPHTMGRAWFEIDTEALMKAQMEKSYRDLSNSQPPRLIKRGQQMAAFLDSLRADGQKLIIGGFSQGAMLSIECLFHMQTLPDAIILLSGTLLDKERWQPSLAKLKPIPFFMSHGSQDPLLDPSAAEKLNEFLLAKQWPGEFVRFVGGHDIPPLVINRLKAFLQNSLRKK